MVCYSPSNSRSLTSITMSLSTLHKLLKNSRPLSSILASRHSPYIHSPNSTLIPQPYSPINENHTINGSILPGSVKDGSLTHFDSLPFSSIHPFGLCSYPVLWTGSIADFPNDEDSGMWADSVKKKRKKKMNKHKYKKLRKRLGRQS